MFYDVYRCFRWVAPEHAFKGALKCSFFPTISVLSLISPRQEPGTTNTAEQCFFQMQYGKSHVYIKQRDLMVSLTVSDCSQGTCWGWMNTHLGASLATARLNPVYVFVNTEITWMLSITKHDIS